MKRHGEVPDEARCKYSIKVKLAIVLSYLRSWGSYKDMKAKYGINIPTCSRAVTQIIHALYKGRSRVFHYPRNE